MGYHIRVKHFHIILNKCITLTWYGIIGTPKNDKKDYYLWDSNIIDSNLRRPLHIELNVKGGARDVNNIWVPVVT